ncbi:uncharacterized protein DNG_01214 [Cephalotrichum gorgonifer]|uniref:AhpC-TSA_2 domain-containing protein n=1 Tax=Cephalotrichum gorgonifer TaxID=2041049 RepID=A0AAE8MQF1_9PEZI|nr:uncharacterized protein DNG_01214 [Cephalotrichum gorgonifer]
MATNTDTANAAAKVSATSTPRRSADTASLPALQTDTSNQRAPTPQKHSEVDAEQPKDFDGEVTTNDELPTAETLKKLEDHLVLDKEGRSRTFRSLYNGKNSARRVLVIFIRHFFCGNCQDYLRTLCESITTHDLLRLPVSASIVVIGCGDPGLIQMYTEATDCPFPIYTDPSRELFDALGMVKTLTLGTRPSYIRRSMVSNVVASVFQGLKQVPAGMATRSGDHRQVGGEFLFEPVDLMSPILEVPAGGEGKEEGPDGEYGPGVKKVVWCHRMRTTRDHTEIPKLRKVLGMGS